MPFTSHPDRGAACGWLLFAACVAVGCAAWRGGRRWVAVGAGCIGLALAALGGALDVVLPVRPETNLAVTVEPQAAAAHEIVLAAHYDSKTEWLDHVQRGVLFVATALVALGALAAAAARRTRWSRGLAVASAAGLAACGLQFTSPAWSRARSHGMADDAAACAVLVELAAELGAAPLARTREEIGAQGSRAWVRRLGAARPDAVVNLECIGAGPEWAILAREWTGAGFASPERSLCEALERAAGAAVPRIHAPAVTDAGPWMSAGVAAVTLLGCGAEGRAPRGMHQAADARDALDAAGVDTVRRLLRTLLAAWDAAPTIGADSTNPAAGLQRDG
jgi:hypothetical protein